VLSLEYTEDEKKVDVLKLTVRNENLANFDNPIWKQGNELTVAWGYVGEMTFPHKTTIQKVTGFTTLTVEAHGPETKLNKIRKCKTFLATSRSSLVRRIMADAGFNGNQVHITDTVEVHETITQARETDAQFLRRLSRIEGLEFFADVDGMHFEQRRLGQKPKKRVHYYAQVEGEPYRGDVISANVSNDVFAKPGAKAGKIRVMGRDPRTKKNFEVVGSEPTTVRDKLGPVSLVVSEEEGKSTLEVNNAMEDTRPTTSSEATAKREADGAYRNAQLQTVELALTLVGDPFIRATDVIEVRGISKRLSGNYFVQQVSHKVGSGYVCTLKCKSDSEHGFTGDNIAVQTATTAAQANSASKVNKKQSGTLDPNELIEVANEDGTVSYLPVTQAKKAAR
jgi:phage protein D